MDFPKNIKVLTGEANWPIWKRKIRDHLDYHEGALDIIDGKLSAPKALATDAKDEEKKEHKAKSDLYRKANSYVKATIASSVTDEVYQKIMDKETAAEVWEALKSEYEATSEDQLFKLCNDFFVFCWTSGEDVSTHTAKLRSLWNDLNNGLKEKKKNELPDLLLVSKTLHILPSSFETFRAGWMLLSKDTEKTSEVLATQLIAFERNFHKRL